MAVAKRIINNVQIRSVEYLNSKDVALVGSFLASNKSKIPIYYQYCQSKKPNEKIDEECRIGYATNFKVFNDDVVCDVQLNPLHVMAHHFCGVIDNYTVNVRDVDGTLKLVITRFIIYNKDFKRRRLKVIAELNLNNKEVL